MKTMTFLTSLFLGASLVISTAYAGDAASLASTTSAPAKPAASAQTSDKVNINTASVESLTTVKGLGNSKAQAIVSYREKNGSFHKLEDLLNVPGIGDKVLEKIKPQLTL